MTIPNGPHTLTITVGGTTTVTIVVDDGGVLGASGFNAFGRRFNYDPAHDWYCDPSGVMHLRFLPGPPPHVVAAWGTDAFGGTWA